MIFIQDPTVNRNSFAELEDINLLNYLKINYTKLT